MKDNEGVLITSLYDAFQERRFKNVWKWEGKGDQKVVSDDTNLINSSNRQLVFPEVHVLP